MDADTVDPSPTTATGPAPATATATATATDRILDLVWRRHRQWSAAADAARKRLDRWRLWNLVLLVLGALTGALAAQTWLAARVATGSAAVAAACLGLAGLLQAHALTGDQTARWTHARAASEALKAETHRYLMRVAPYAQADRAQVLQAHLDVVRTRAAALLADQQDVPADDRPLPTLHTVQEYVTARAQGQATSHRARSAEHARRARRLRTWQLVATGVGVVLAAITGFCPSWRPSTWTAAATTIAAAFGAHLAATQHQGIAASTRSARDARRRLRRGHRDTATAGGVRRRSRARPRRPEPGLDAPLEPGAGGRDTRVPRGDVTDAGERGGVGLPGHTATEDIGREDPGPRRAAQLSRTTPAAVWSRCIPVADRRSTSPPAPRHRPCDEDGDQSADQCDEDGCRGGAGEDEDQRQQHSGRHDTPRDRRPAGRDGDAPP